MSRSQAAVFLALFVALLCARGVALADVPGAPPAEPPDCPAGTRLEGVYRHWSCVPCRPEEPCDAPVPLVVEPPSEPVPPPAPPASEPVEPTTDPEPSQARSVLGCSAGSGSGGRTGAFLALAVLALVHTARRARRR